jgi:hypothetical protein
MVITGNTTRKTLNKVSPNPTMPPKKLITFVLVVTVVFIAFGDKLTFLPKPAKEASVKSRDFVVSLWPQWLRPRNTNEKTDKQLENLDKPTESKP